jgi:hypothetical protein
MPVDAPEGADRLFEVTLRRSPGMKIGIDVQHVAVLGSNGLGVKAISSGGVVDAHNKSCPPDERIEVGDILLALDNGYPRPQRLMQDFLSNDVIEVVVLRGNADVKALRNADVSMGTRNQNESGFVDASSKGVLNIGKTNKGGPSKSEHFSEASTAFTNADANKFTSVDSQFSTNSSEVWPSATLTSTLTPIGESHGSGHTVAQGQDNHFKLDYWEQVLSQPLGSDPDICIFQGGLPRMGCMTELPPLEAILDGCDADDLVNCLPDYEVEDLSSVMSGMRRPPAMEEVIEAHRLFAAQKAK